MQIVKKIQKLSKLISPPTSHMERWRVSFFHMTTALSYGKCIKSQIESTYQ